MPRPAVTSSAGSSAGLSPPRALGALLAPLALIGALTGCAAGFDAQTSEMYTAPAGADVRTGDVKGLNMLVVADEEGTGTLVAALVNTTSEDDELVGVTVTDNDSQQPVEVTGIDSPVPLPAGELVQVADAQSPIPPIGVEGEPVVPGAVLQVSLTFSSAGAVDAEIPVMAREAQYVDVPTPEPTEEPVPEATAEQPPE